MAGLLAPGPTRAAAEELRAKRGSRGLLEAVGTPLSYAPLAPVAAVGQGLLGARYLTGEKEMGGGLASLSDMTAMMIGNRLPPLVRAAIGYHGSPRKFDQFDMNAEKTTGGGLNKHGVSISPSEKVAQRYATDFSGGSGYVYKVDADYKKPLNLSAREFDKLQKTVGKMDRGERLTESESIDVELLLKKAGIGFKDGDHPIKNIRSAGFDAINGMAHPYGAEAETLVFDPVALKILSRDSFR